MSTKKITVAAVSPKIFVGNPTKNCDEILDILDNFKNKGIDVIAFPELTLCGSTCGDLFFQNTLIEACEKSIIRIRRLLKTIWIPIKRFFYRLFSTIKNFFQQI